MHLLMRAVVWFGIFVGLVLAPLGLAALTEARPTPRSFRVELGVALGFVAYALIAIEFALVARMKALSLPFGTDALMLFHRLMGLAALGFAAAHPLLLWGQGVRLGSLNPFSGTTVGRTGAIALWATAFLVGSSLWRRRLRLPHERWQFIHRVLAFVIMGAMLWHVLAVSGYADAPLVRALLIGYACLFLALMVRYRVLRPFLLWRRPWEVAENRDEGGDTRTLVLRPRGHPGIEFTPGQFVWLDTGRTPFRGEQHPITISSSSELPADRAIELSIKALGDWSRSTVPAIAPGSRAWVDGPFGAFTPDRTPAQGFVLIAGGIGITPMRSILLTMRDRGDPRPVLLLYAANSRDRAVFADELEALQQEMALDLVYVFEDPPASWEGERGFVTADVLRRHLPADRRHRHFFVCGPGPMMDAMERVLVELGVPDDRVETERFDML